MGVWEQRSGSCRPPLLKAGGPRLPQVQGKSWQGLVQGRACGRLVPSDSPPEETPSDLCRSHTVRCDAAQLRRPRLVARREGRKEASSEAAPARCRTIEFAF